MTERISCLIADDQAMVREGFGALLAAQPGITVAALAADGAEAVTLARRTRPDVVLMDVRMPVLDGLAATRELLQAGRGEPAPRVLMLTTFDLDEYVYEALRAGASGFLLKDAPAAELAKAIRRVHAGERVVDPALAAAALAEGASPLTPRETEVLSAARGHAAISDLAASLHLSQGTVRNHLSAAIQKLGARNRAEAVQIAERKGWL